MKTSKFEAVLSIIISVAILGFFNFAGMRDSFNSIVDEVLLKRETVVEAKVEYYGNIKTITENINHVGDSNVDVLTVVPALNSSHRTAPADPIVFGKINRSK